MPIGIFRRIRGKLVFLKKKVKGLGRIAKASNKQDKRFVAFADKFEKLEKANLKRTDIFKKRGQLTIEKQALKEARRLERHSKRLLKLLRKNKKGKK